MHTLRAIEGKYICNIYLITDLINIFCLTWYLLFYCSYYPDSWMLLLSLLLLLSLRFLQSLLSLLSLLLLFKLSKKFFADTSIPITTVILVTSVTGFNSVSFVNTDYIISILGQKKVYTVKYSPFPEGVPTGEARGNTWRQRAIFGLVSRVES